MFCCAKSFENLKSRVLKWKFVLLTFDKKSSFGKEILSGTLDCWSKQVLFKKCEFQIEANRFILYDIQNHTGTPFSKGRRLDRHFTNTFHVCRIFDGHC